MNVSIAGKHMEMSDALKSYIENGLKKLEHYFDRIVDANVVLTVEKHRHICEVNLNVNGFRIHAKESSTDMYASVDTVIDKLEKQIKKFKDKLKNHKPRHREETKSYKHLIIEVKEETTKPESKEEIPIVSHEIIHREHITLKPMTVEEALMQIQLLEEPFLVFINAETSQVNVIYPRGDCTFGLIEPQF
ncbi:MAG: ribosome-associated translation inhibitor RaiA [Candidatus Hydrogenedentes bacterium]|nr:ribosome-associated translation inhibitor RaiA [Candidatus Hydrogenedentota bacterium]